MMHGLFYFLNFITYLNSSRERRITLSIYYISIVDMIKTPYDFITL